MNIDVIYILVKGSCSFRLHGASAIINIFLKATSTMKCPGMLLATAFSISYKLNEFKSMINKKRLQISQLFAGHQRRHAT